MGKNTTIQEEERECVGLCEKTKPLSEFVKERGYTFFCKPCRKEIDDKGLNRCPICNKWKPLSESVEDFTFCKECKEKELDNFKDCFCLLPNSKWLKDMLNALTSPSKSRISSL